jgi:hypothetical protein
LADGKAKAELNAEKARILAECDDARKEAAVQKALADGWARDLKVCLYALKSCD